MGSEASTYLDSDFSILVAQIAQRIERIPRSGVGRKPKRKPDFSREYISDHKCEMELRIHHYSSINTIRIDPDLMLILAARSAAVFHISRHSRISHHRISHHSTYNYTVETRHGRVSLSLCSNERSERETVRAACLDRRLRLDAHAFARLKDRSARHGGQEGGCGAGRGQAEEEDESEEDEGGGHAPLLAADALAGHLKRKVKY